MEGSKITNLGYDVECKFCGNNRHFEIKDNGYICKCCGAWNRSHEEPKAKEDELVLTRLSQAYEYLHNYDFERARNTFQRIIKDAPDNIDAYWGFLLAKFGVVYVRGFFNGIIEPIYCFPDYDHLGNVKIRNTREFAKILELVGDDKNLRDLYNEHSLKIDRAILNFRKSIDTAENDVFICVKISNATENNPGLKGHTEDSRQAEKLERDLKALGVKVFYSLHTLTKEVDSDDQIWMHLVKSKKMILIGSREDYLESTWVKSEWMRWLHLDRQNELYIYVPKHDDQMPVSVLPYELRTTQIYTLDTYDKLLKDIAGIAETASEQEEDRDGRVVSANGTEERIAYGTEEISAYAYRDREDIVRAVLPEGIKRICNEAFANCRNLYEVVLPESLLHIGDDAFSGCESLQKIYIPYRTETVGSQAFCGCRSLDRITVPASVKKIGTGVFSYCENLKGITVDKRNKDYRGNGDCIVDIKRETLIAGCMSTKIPGDDSIVRIGYNSFCGCAHLTSVEIPDSVQEIDEGAFMDCRNLKTVALTSSVDRIGDEAFLGCGSLANVKYNASEVMWKNISLGRGNQALTKAYEASHKKPQTVKEEPKTAPVSVKPKLTGLEAQLQDAEERLSQTLAQRLELEKDQRMKKQQKAEIHTSAETSKQLEFELRTAANQAAKEKELAQKNEKIALESKMKAVREMELKAQSEADARANAEAASRERDSAAKAKAAARTRAEETAKEASAAQARAEAAAREAAAAKLKAEAAAAEMSAAIAKAEEAAREQSAAKARAEAAASEKARAAANARDAELRANSAREEIRLKSRAESEARAKADAAKREKDKAFAESSRLDDEISFMQMRLNTSDALEKSIRLEIEDLVIRIGKQNPDPILEKPTGDGKIVYSDGREETLPHGMTRIADAAYSGNNMIVKVILPQGLTEIGARAFLGCINLKIVQMPDTVEKIGNMAFNKCAGLTEVNLSAGLTEIANGTFQRCENLKEIVIPYGVTKIGSGAFNKCAKLEKIELPDTVRSIGTLAFAGCCVDESILPSDDIEISDRAFDF